MGSLFAFLFVFFLLLVVLSIFRLTFLVSSLVSWKLSYTSSTCTRLDEIFSTNTVISYCTNPLKRSLCIKSSDDTKNILNLPLDEGTKAGFVTRVPRWVPQVEEELLTLRGHPSSPLPPPPTFCSIISILYIVCLWLFFMLSFDFCPLHCLSFVDFQLWLPLWYLRFMALIAPLVS